MHGKMMLEVSKREFLQFGWMENLKGEDRKVHFYTSQKTLCLLQIADWQLF